MVALPSSLYGRRTRVGLDVALVGGGHAVLGLDDDVGFREARFHVAAFEALLGGDVARRLAGVAVGVLALVDERCAVGDRVVDAEHRRQGLVLHLDEIERRLGLRDRLGRHGGNRVAVVEHLVASEYVLGQVVLGAGEIGAGNRGQHAVGGAGLRQVHALDAGMGVGAAQHLAVQHVGEVQVCAERRPSSYLFDAVGAHRTGADCLQIYRFCHFGSPWMSVLRGRLSCSVV